jgi:hypothetical protein
MWPSSKLRAAIFPTIARHNFVPGYRVGNLLKIEEADFAQSFHVF